MSTKRQIREQREREEMGTRADRRLGVMKWTYLGVCVLLLAALLISLKSGLFLLQHSRSAKDVTTALDAYIAWPEEVRAPFQRVLIQNGGRVKPLNTFARFTLLQINNGTKVKFATADGEDHKIDADEWLLDTLFRGDVAKEMPIFNVDDTDTVAALGLEPKKGSDQHRKRDRYSYNHLLTIRPQLAEEGQRIREKQDQYTSSGEDPQYELTREETQVLRLSRNVSFFEYLVGQFGVVRKGEHMVNDQFLPAHLQQIASRLDMREFLDLMPEMSPQQLMSIMSQQSDSDDARLMQSPFQLFFFFANSGQNLQIFPPLDRLNEEWVAIGTMAFDAMQDKSKREWAQNALAKISDVHQTQKVMFDELADLPERPEPSAFGAVVKPAAAAMTTLVDSQRAEVESRYRAKIDHIDAQIAAADEELEKERLRDRKKRQKEEAATSDREVRYYNAGYFHSSLAYFILGFLVLAASWLAPGSRVSKVLVWIASAIIVLALVYNLVGVTERSIIRGRPPITNLYDTIIFITAVVVMLALLIEWATRRGVGLILASLGGAAGIFVSMRYEVKEATDTMDPLQAVLDTNFWLATHVTTINIGYAAGLLAMLLGGYYLIHRFLRPLPTVLGSVFRSRPLPQSGIFDENKDSRDFFRSISKMTYGGICFCLFFSIVGTVLGGVWANYSWGRFWGWDPKENGALMICLWSLVILHAKMGGYIRDIGIAVNSIFLGMIVTFSWWGVNNLGIGLHSYGFTDGVWESLFITWAVCGLVMACGIPLWLHERAARKAKKEGDLSRRTREVSSPEMEESTAPV